MPTRTLAAVLFVVLSLAPAGSDDKKSDKKKKKGLQTLGEKVVEYCEAHKGEQVGNGECAALASVALKEVGAHGRYADFPNQGDYVWGKLVYTLEAGQKPSGKLADVKPGAVIQFRDAKWVTRMGNRTRSTTAPHHTAIVTAVNKETGVLFLLHQNHSGKRFVIEGALPLGDLKEGWIRVYEPQPR